MANKTEIYAIEAGEAIAESQGVYIVDVSYKRNDDTYSLTYYIDKEGGIGIDQCEEFSRAVEEKLDADDYISEAYTLEVSSPGADRKLTKEREFLYYKNRTVDVKLYKAVDNVKEFTGVLKDYNKGIAEIDVNGDIRSVDTKEAAYIRLHFEF